jgi:MOSC domain-containing protein YiiM
VVSVNVGGVRRVEWRRTTVETGIFKEPVSGRVHVGRLGLDGDRQADLSVHGGPEKAVYAYPLEHYGPWRDELPELALEAGAFGENLTVAGLPLEDEIHVGDRMAVGSSELVVTQPRLPCFKLGIRFGRADMVKRFLMSRRTGYYFSVLVEGEIQAGDGIVPVARAAGSVPVAEITRLYAFDHDDEDAVRRVIAAPGLPESWRAWFADRLGEGYDLPRAATSAATRSKASGRSSKA